MLQKIAKLWILTCWCLFVVQSAFAEEAPKAFDANGCTYLNVNINSPTGPASVTSSGVACDHGYLSSIQPSQSNTTLVVLQQSAVYGPDCTVTIKVGAKTAVIRAQQNYCALEAGNVLASVVSGPAVITGTQSGSYANSKPGQVFVTMN